MSSSPVQKFVPSSQALALATDGRGLHFLWPHPESGDKPAGFGGAFGCENGFTAAIFGLVLRPWPQCSIVEEHEVAMERTKSVFASRRFEMLRPDSRACLRFNFHDDFRDGDAVLI